MKTKNGTTQDVSGRRKNGQRENESTGLGELRENSSVDGVNQIGATALHRSGENTAWSDAQGNPTPGKILKRLELIEKTFLSYVHGHQERLETRLEESKNVESAFKDEVQALKEEIYNLASNTDE